MSDDTKQLKAEVEKAQGQRDLAEQARRAAVAEAQQKGQRINELEKEVAAVTDSRDENQRLKTENAELKAAAKQHGDAASKAAAIVEAHRVFAQAEAALKKLV